MRYAVARYCGMRYAVYQSLSEQLFLLWIAILLSVERITPFTVAMDGTEAHWLEGVMDAKGLTLAGSTFAMGSHTDTVAQTQGSGADTSTKRKERTHRAITIIASTKTKFHGQYRCVPASASFTPKHRSRHPDNCLFSSSIYFPLDKSIQTIFTLILKTEALVPTLLFFRGQWNLGRIHWPVTDHSKNRNEHSSEWPNRYIS